MEIEDHMKQLLKEWLEKKGWRVFPKEVELPKMKYGSTSRPDVLAYKKRANVIYLIECKRATRLRYVGHGFGQILADKLQFRKISKSSLKKKLEDVTRREIDLRTFKVEFGVAFPKEHIDKSKSVNRMTEMFHDLDLFKDFAVCLVRSKDKHARDGTIQTRHKGRLILHDELAHSKNK
jgi:hypothetical protein